VKAENSPSFSRRILAWIGAAVFLAGLLIYVLSALERLRASCAGVSISADAGGEYLAKYYYLGNGTAFVRLFRAKTGVLLAERTFRYGSGVELLWENSSLVYSTNDHSVFYDGIISLPPTMMDRLLTVIP
jgi:hypothetical protein